MYKSLHISEHCVFILLDRIDVTKAYRPDILPGTLPQCLTKEITPVLHYIFSQSLYTGIISTEGTQANVAPIFKKSSEIPFCISHMYYILYDDIICKYILTHQEDHTILTDLQHGFKLGRLCETQLVTILKTK